MLFQRRKLKSLKNGVLEDATDHQEGAGHVKLGKNYARWSKLRQNDVYIRLHNGSDLI